MLKDHTWTNDVNGMHLNENYDQVFAARWKLLGPLDCSLPSLADLLLTSAESWLVGAC